MVTWDWRINLQCFKCVPFLVLNRFRYVIYRYPCCQQHFSAILLKWHCSRNASISMTIFHLVKLKKSTDKTQVDLWVVLQFLPWQIIIRKGNNWIGFGWEKKNPPPVTLWERKNFSLIEGLNIHWSVDCGEFDHKKTRPWIMDWKSGIIFTEKSAVFFRGKYGVYKKMHFSSLSFNARIFCRKMHFFLRSTTNHMKSLQIQLLLTIANKGFFFASIYPTPNIDLWCWWKSSTKPVYS